MINRRHFVIATSALLTMGFKTATTASTTMQPDEIILGGGKYLDLDSDQIKHVLSLVNLQDQSTKIISCNFLPHGVHSNPANKSRMALFEKKGPGACEFDLTSRKITRYIPTHKGRHFYGHGAYTLNGETLFATETELTNMRGVIAIRNTRDMDYLGEFPSYGLEPHECKLIDNGRTLVVTNGGGTVSGQAPSVAYIDVNNQQLIEKVELSNDAINAGHIAVAEDGSLVVVSAPRLGLGETHLGGVSIRPKGETMQTIKKEAISQQIYGEALSVVIVPGKGIAAVTHPSSNMITLWSTKNRSLIKTLQIESPRGIALSADNSQLLISYGKNADLMQLAVDTLNMADSKIIQQSYFSGSHIYNWSREMEEILAPGPIL
jgi:hypothetical protein